MEINPKAIEVIDLVKKAVTNSITGYTFFSIREYTNTSGEKANHLINIGINMKKAKELDLEMLRSLDLTKAKKNNEFESNLEALQEAKAELIVSLINPSESHSNGQIDAYTHLFNGVKVHNETAELYVYGFTHSKTILVEGNYNDKKPVKSSAKTIAKREVEKLMKSKKYRQYTMKLGEGQVIKTSGETIELI